MYKTYTCTISNKTFHSEEELMNHYLSNYVIQEDSKEKVENMRQAFLHAFPESEISIRQNKKMPTSFFVEIDDLPYELFYTCTITPYANPHNRENPGNFFPSMDDLILYLKSNIEAAGKFIEKVIEHFPRIDNVSISHLYLPAYGAGLNATIDVIANGRIRYFEYACDGKSDDIALRKIDGLFASYVTGEVKIGCIDETDSVYIDGVCLKDILERSKQLHIEIIEKN